MIQSRIRGIRTLQILLTVVFLPLWFQILAQVGERGILFELLTEHINLTLYTVAAALAGLLSHAYRPVSYPRPGFRWVYALHQSNRDLLILALLILGIIWATKDKAISRQFVGFYLVTSWLGLLLLNRFSFNLLSAAFLRGEQTIRTVLVGSPDLATYLEKWARQRRSLGVEVLGIIGRGPVPEGSSLPLLGPASQMESILEEKEIHQVILLETRNSKSWVRHVTDICQKQGCRLLIYNHWQVYFTQPMAAINEGELTFFTLQDEPLQNPLNRILKRLLDLAVALPVVFLLLPPMAIFIKIMQMLQSRGPLLYRQYRSGFSRKPFQIYKFRSMHVEPEADEGQQARKNDPRAFSFGAFMRRTSLDEFPQFINVLKGQMSVVGPRPHMLEHDEYFRQYVDIYRQRHFVKPGITGLAQERGYRGEIIAPRDIENRVAFDLEYIRNWSIWLDIGLILRTARQVLSPKSSAY